MTTFAQTGDRERFLAAGLSDDIAKPMDFDALEAWVSRLVGAAPPLKA